MQKTFNVGTKVKVLNTAYVGADLELRGKVGKVTAIGRGNYAARHIEYMLTFEGETKECYLHFYADELESILDGKELIQVIVNTKGLARRVTQQRDSLGRFVKGANVGLLLSPGHVMGKHENAVVVHYGYTMFAQTVTSINPVSGRMNCKTFTNDGVSKFSEHTVQVQPK